MLSRRLQLRAGGVVCLRTGFGLGRETALKVAAAFGAGVGRMGERAAP
ncbi:MAG: hypothetical protein AB1426_12020 [Bacillota bacterium]